MIQMIQFSNDSKLLRLITYTYNKQRGLYPFNDVNIWTQQYEIFISDISLI